MTPKDVDETIKYLSYTISEGLNMTLSREIDRCIKIRNVEKEKEKKKRNIRGKTPS